MPPSLKKLWDMHHFECMNKVGMNDNNDDQMALTSDSQMCLLSGSGGGHKEFVMDVWHPQDVAAHECDKERN